MDNGGGDSGRSLERLINDQLLVVQGKRHQVEIWVNAPPGRNRRSDEQVMRGMELVRDAEAILRFLQLLRDDPAIRRHIEERILPELNRAARGHDANSGPDPTDG